MDIDRVYEAVTELKEGQTEFKDTIATMGFEQKQIAKDVRYWAEHTEKQNGRLGVLEMEEVRRTQREETEEKDSGNLKWYIGALIAGMSAILAAAEGLRTL